MKASSCHDPKMEAYCKDVHKLENKFHFLELVHIARRNNEVADELAKIASTRGTVPPDTFSRHLLKPSVNLSAGASIKAPTPEPADTIEALRTTVAMMEAEQTPRCPR